MLGPKHRKHLVYDTLLDKKRAAGATCDAYGYQIIASFLLNDDARLARIHANCSAKLLAQTLRLLRKVRLFMLSPAARRHSDVPDSVTAIYGWKTSR